jgi:cyanophycinase
MNFKTILFICCFFFISLITFSQANPQAPKGKLFIIGGGDRTPELINALIKTAELSSQDYIAVLPMSSEYADTAYYYIKADLETACTNTIANLNFTKDKLQDQKWIDSLKNARLIFITGGDQTRFMNLVLHSPVYEAIHYAYINGATVAGTSAGAAMMSKNMITGKELVGDTTYYSTFRKLKQNNIDLQEGLGLIDSVILDQHFVARSRYNRLISAIAKFPGYACIGIDEATAIIVHGNKVTVTGESQVVVLSDPRGLTIKDSLIKMNDLHFSIYTSGDVFFLNRRGRQ